MSFEYFNTSHLAFGSKLTRAFRQLEKMCGDAELTIARFTSDVAYLGEYVNRNYRVPFPTSATSAVRANELFDVINDETIVKEMSYKDDIFTVAINRFNRDNNRFTIGKGSTDLKKGYAFMSDSVSNLNPTSEIKFYEDLTKAKGDQLFKFRIDSYGFINIVSDSNSVLKFNKGGIDHINNIEVGEQVILPYTATDYEAVVVLGRHVSEDNSVVLYLNDQLIYSMGGTEINQYAMTYLKPNDKLSASSYNKAYKLIYNHVGDD